MAIRIEHLCPGFVVRMGSHGHTQAIVTKPPAGPEAAPMDGDYPMGG
ncbi:MAG: hypothetical protein ABSE70_06135 [Candidatus Limnocylindrales bacterium]